MFFLKRIENRIIPATERKPPSGQTMVEAIIAVGLVMFAILGVFRMMSQSLGLTRVVRDQYVGNYLAAEGVELIKNMVATNVQNGINWNSGLELSGASYEIDYTDTIGTIRTANNRKLRFDPVSGFYGYQVGLPVETVFERIVTVAYPDCPAPDCADHLQVNSAVAWTTRSGGQFDINIESHLFNWVP